MTDSSRSPFASVATLAIAVGVESQSFFHAMVRSLLAAEAVVALVAANKGEAALRALKNTERRFVALGSLLVVPHLPKAGIKQREMWRSSAGRARWSRGGRIALA